MFKKIKQFFIGIGQWIKAKWKSLLLFLGIGVALAYGIGGPIDKNEVSTTKLAEKYNQAVEIKSKYQLATSTLEMTDIKNAELDKYKGEPKDEIKVILGDKDKTEFVPNIEMKRWNEVGFKLKTDNLLKGVETKDKGLTFEGKKVKLSTPKISFEMYDYAEGEGGYKYIWYLNEKPATNTISFQIESSGLDFFYQPPLTEEYQNGYSEEFQKEIVVSETQVKDLEGNVLVERPENVVGSYAVYHSTKGGMNDINGKEYKTGKAFHIYRPHIIDANSVETWGILHIENGIYSVEIPQDFLDKAVYPIKSNDDFGYKTIGTAGLSTVSVYGPYRCAYTVGATGGTVTSMSFAVESNAFDGGHNHNLATAIYSGANVITNGNTPSTLLFIPNAGAPAFLTINYVTSPTISASTAYNLALACDQLGGNNANFNYDNGGTYHGYDTTAYASIWPTWSDDGSGTRKFSIYATYTPSGGGATAPVKVPDVIIFE